MSDLSHVVTGLSGVDREGARCSRAADMEAVSSVWGVGKPISPSKRERLGEMDMKDRQYCGGEKGED